MAFPGLMPAPRIHSHISQPRTGRGNTGTEVEEIQRDRPRERWMPSLAQSSVQDHEKEEKNTVRKERTKRTVLFWCHPPSRRLKQTRGKNESVGVKCANGCGRDVV